MADVYAQAIEIRRGAGDAFPAHFVQILKEWMSDRWPQDHAGLDPEQAQTFRARDGSIFRWEPFRRDNHYFADFILRHPDRTSPDSSWSTRVTVSHADSTIVYIRIANSSEDSSRAATLTSRPRLALHLADRFGCICDGHPLTTRPRALRRQEITDLATYVLLDPDRRYPVILLTPRADGSYVDDPKVLARHFASLGMFACAEGRMQHSR